MNSNQVIRKRTFQQMEKTRVFKRSVFKILLMKLNWIQPVFHLSLILLNLPRNWIFDWTPQISWHEISFEVLSHVGDECWRRDLLVTCLRCWWHDSDKNWHILGTLYNEFHSKWILKFLSGKQFACSKGPVMRFSTFETGWVFIWR